MLKMAKDIAADLKDEVVPYMGTVRHVLGRAFLFLAVALLVEIFAFNFNYFQSAGYNTIDLSSQLERQLDKTSDGFYRLTATRHTVEFQNVNADIKNIRVDFSGNAAAQVVHLDIHFTDEAHHTYFNSTEYSVGMPKAAVATNVEESEFVNLKTAGLVDSLKIDVTGDNISYPIKIRSIYLNDHCPFGFNGVRFGVLFMLLVLVYVFRPGSSIYRCYVAEQPRKSKAIIVISVALELAIMASFMFFNSAAVGVATSTYNNGSWDGKSIVNSFEVGGDSAQQFAEMAKSLAQGRLCLEQEPPQWLVDMDEPYDKGARDELVKTTGEGYLWDVAYYDGHYYVYFGIVPIILFYLPFYLLTGANFPTAIGVLIGCFAFVLGLTMLLGRFAQHHFRKVSLGLFLLLQIPLVTCSGVLYLLKFPTLYSLPIMTGLAFSVWGFYLWIRGRASQRPEGWYLAGSLCMALVFGCRPQLCILSLVAFPLFWRKFITKRHILSREGARQFLCLIGPYVVIIVAVGWYNWARFGSPGNFGANYNLTMNDMTKRGWDIGRVAPAFFAYFLQTPATTGVFPYLQPVTFDTTYMGQTIREVTFGGIFACLPLLWTLAFSGRALKMRIRSHNTRTVAGIIVLLVVSGVVVAMVDAQMAGILQRYYADFSFMFLAAAILVCFILNENLQQGSEKWKLLLRVLIALVAVSVCYSVLTCLVAETGWISSSFNWAYQSLLETFQFWT